MVTYCKTAAQAQAECVEFVSTAVGQSFTHPDYGNQCSTLAQRFSRALFGKSEYDTLGWGNAIDHVNNASPAYFEKIYNNPANAALLPKAGDIIVWQGAAPLWGGQYYGHVALVKDPKTTTVRVVQQDGAAEPSRLWPQAYQYRYSVKAAHEAEFAYINGAGVGDVIGWLRPKPGKVIYTGADKRGYGNTPVDPVPPVVSAVRDFIDVSDWQPGDVVRNVRTDAVVIKATEGVSWKSAHMADHIAAARAKGIPYMLYAFARASQNGSDAEAAWFLRAARPYLTDPLFSGLVLDWEEDSVAHYAVWASDFLAYLRKHAPGVHLVIYTRAGFLPAKGWRSKDKKAPVWLAAYGNDKRMNGYATDFKGAPVGSNGFIVSAWQYSQHGYLPGYARNLDLNRALTPAMWPTRAPATAQQTTKKTETVLEWIVSNKDEAEALMRRVAREEFLGTMDHITAEVDDRGKKIMNRVRDAYRQGVGDLVIEGTEESPGQMTFAKHLMYARRERARDEDLRTQVSETHAGVKTLALGVLSIIVKLTPARTGAHAADTTTEQEV